MLVFLDGLEMMLIGRESKTGPTTLSAVGATRRERWKRRACEVSVTWRYLNVLRSFSSVVALCSACDMKQGGDGVVSRALALFSRSLLKLRTSTADVGLVNDGHAQGRLLVGDAPGDVDHGRRAQEALLGAVGFLGDVGVVDGEHGLGQLAGEECVHRISAKRAHKDKNRGQPM